MAQERNQIKFVLRALEQVAETVIKKITLSATANLQRGTPVKTAWARSNWIPSIGVPRQTVAGSKSGDDVTLDTSASTSGLIAITTGYTLPQGNVFITNNVPYIKKLNEGSSKKAPAGFVQSAIQKAVLKDLTF